MATLFGSLLKCSSMHQSMRSVERAPSVKISLVSGKSSGLFLEDAEDAAFSWDRAGHPDRFDNRVERDEVGWQLWLRLSGSTGFQDVRKHVALC